MSNYNVNYTDVETTPIPMQEGTEDNTTLDIAVFGNTFLEYGQELNENILHLLENFSCPMTTGSTFINAVPDTSSVNGSYNHLLTHPTRGQIWYNSTVKHIYYWDGTAWRPITDQGDIAANWGIIAHGQQLPKPVSPKSGYVFPYSECIWSVSPANFGFKFDYMACATDSLATVTMQYRAAGSSSLTNGVANYLIIGIKGNTNHGVQMTPPAVSGSPTPTPSGTPAASGSATPTPTTTTTATQTPIPSGTAQPTPTSSRTSTPAPSASSTSGPASPTPTPSSPPGPSASSTPPPPSASSTPAPPSPTPTPSTSPIHPLDISSVSPSSLYVQGSGGAHPAGVVITVTTGDGGGPSMASVTATGGVPPYTFYWHSVGGSLSFAIDDTTAAATLFRSSRAVPSAAGGSCDGCTGAIAASDCPPTAFGGGYNMTCAQVACTVTDSVGTSITSPTFDVVFIFNNDA